MFIILETCKTCKETQVIQQATQATDYLFLVRWIDVYFDFSIGNGLLKLCVKINRSFVFWKLSSHHFMALYWSASRRLPQIPCFFHFYLLRNFGWIFVNTLSPLVFCFLYRNLLPSKFLLLFSRFYKDYLLFLHDINKDYYNCSQHDSYLE